MTLLGASPQAGGKLRWEATLPGRDEYRHVLAWMERQLRDAGAKAELGHTATADSVLALKPDAVIVATGSHLRPPETIEGGESTRDWDGHLKLGRSHGVAVLFDMDHSAATYAVADALAGATQLVLLTPRTQIARNVNYCSAIGVYRRLYEADAEIVLAAEPSTCATAC